MNIVRKIHDLFRVKTVAGAQLETPEAVSSLGAGGSTFITITGGGGTSLNGSGLSEEDRVKLDSIELGALVNLDAFSKIQFNATSIDENDLSSSSNSSIIANVPTDTANIKIVGNYPITVNLESVSLFNSNTSTTTGTAITTYNISFNSSNNIVIEYVDGALLNAADVELIQVKHKEDVLATYLLSDITYTTSEGTITSFTIPYSNTDFSEIEFCKYETVTTETETGSTTVRELRVLSTLPASPTKQSIITLNSLTDSFWNYEEDENGNKFVWTDYNVYSTKEVSAYGKAEEQLIPTILNLSLLQDVALTNLADNLVLVYSSSSLKWVNVDVNSLGILADNLKTLTITVNGTSYTYNPATSNQSISIATITLDDILPYISSKLDREEFFKWFTINYDSNNNVTSILANYDFYSVKGISAYGLGDIGSTTRTTLSSLDDVSLSNLVVDNMLAYNGSKWVNIPMSQVRGVTSWADLENKPTTVSGFGITDVYTKTEVNTKISEVSSKVTELSSSKADAAIQVIVGNGLTGGGNLLQDITIALLNLNSTGTYYKVNVDTYGRVVSGISYITIADILNLQTQLDSKLNVADFNTWFTIIYNTDGTIKNIRANYDFYSVGAVSAYGIGDEEKKTYTTLAELNDVQLTNEKLNDVLVYNGTKWVNVDQSTIRGITSWTDLENKPTTISGFGIVDAYTKTEIDNKLYPINSSITTINSSINTINTNISDLSSSLSSVSTKLNNFLEGSDTDTIINKWKELEAFLAGYTQTQTLADLLSVKANSSILIIAGTGLVGGGDLTANRTISLSTSGVSAGTYTKVTVDTYGRVTSGSTLSATDIPNLDWSKITSGKPTTLAGYGITDGVNNITFTGSGNAITAVTISNHLLTFTKGETFLPKSTFDDLFEKVNVGTTSNPVYAIKAKYHLYSVGEVSAYEFGGAGGTGSSSLEELIDVQLTNLVADSILKYNGSKWVNVPITEVKGATSWNEIEDKPSTFTPSAHTHTVADITDISTKYVSISTTLTVSGLKTFTNTVKYQPTYYSYNAEDIEYRTTSGTLFGGIGAVHNGSSISYFYIGKGSTPWDTKDGLTIGDELGFKGYTVWHSGNAIIPTVPTKLSAFKDDILAGKYLPLSGGTVIGILGAPQFSAQSGGIYTNYRLYLPESASSTSSTTRPRIGRFDRAEGSAVLQLGTSNIFDIVDASWSTTLLRVSSSVFTYKGSAVSLNGHTHTISQITDFPSSLKNPYSITIQANGTSLGNYDGSAAKTFNLTYSNVGAAAASHTHNYLPLSGGTMSGQIQKTGLSSAWITGRNNAFLRITTIEGYSPFASIKTTNGSWEIGAYDSSSFYDDLVFSYCTDANFNIGNNATPAQIRFFENGTIGASITGNAATATALTSSAGSSTIPIYFSSGKPVQCSTTLGVSITGNAKTATDADTVDGYHESSFAKIADTNNLIHSGNEFTFVPSKFSGVVWLNYRTTGGTNGAITDYRFGNGAGGALASISDGQFSGNATSATKLQTARTIWGHTFDGTANVSGSLSNTGTITASAAATYDIGSNSLDYRYGYFQWIGAKSNTNLRLAANNSDNQIVLHINGNVGIGTNSPSVKLHVIGDIAATGAVTAKASSSDIRLKTDITDYKALSIIRSHKSIKYHWNEVAKANADIFNDDYWHYGLIAQDVQRDMPQMVSDVFKDYLVINYERLIPICWKGLQEVDDEVTKLKKRVKQLEKRLLKYESTEVFYIKGND